MSEKQAATQKKVLVDPFTGRRAEVAYFDPSVNRDPNLMDKLDLELNKDTGNTEVVVTGQTDIDREIQEFKNQCGFEGMRDLIAKGQATPKDFYDDGRHGQDLSGMPDSIHDAYRAAMASSSDAGNLFRELGVKTVFNSDGSINFEATEKALTDAIQAKYAKVEVKDNGDASK